MKNGERQLSKPIEMPRPRSTLRGKKMRFEKNIWMLLAPMLLSVTISCQTTKIPNVRFYAEIPFQDCPEAVYIDSLTKERGIIGCEQWKAQRPLMIMVDPIGKKAIFQQWSEACRWADESCNVELDSVKKTVEALDSIAGKLIPLPKGK